ncbi:MAG: DUF4254 domain-containing protein [Candidatus Omnitrophica bacterium]|nr:DUF4254 domain-containing protein [Candidatus Omnitrophota bacterium]MBU4478589.1 DUF4254 domain-containing protein [Candidatus Omnitrophota bacterium]
MDKLTIKSIREFYLNKLIKSRKSDFPLPQLKEKMGVLKRQKKLLTKEIDEFIISAAENKFPLREEKLKLYNKPSSIGKIGKAQGISQTVDKLAQKNLELWQLEDQSRRTDVPLEYIGKVKRKIDLANQQRNDLIDRIDELFEKEVRK